MSFFTRDLNNGFKNDGNGFKKMLISDEKRLNCTRRDESLVKARKELRPYKPRLINNLLLVPTRKNLLFNGKALRIPPKMSLEISTGWEVTVV